MSKSTANLRKRLRNAGLSDAAIDAAWPSWWSDEAELSPSARAELQFSIARKLGISPKSLHGDQVEFIWRDEARFKHLNAKDLEQKATLASYGVALGRLLAQCTEAPNNKHKISAAELRVAILRNYDYVDLKSLVGTCWALGVPVIHLRVFPLDTKSMHAMAVRSGDRFAILIGRDANYPAPVAFTLAHEFGHIAGGHLSGVEAIVDFEDPAEDVQGGDREEEEADRFALELLTGRPEPDFRTNLQDFNGRQLAQSAVVAGPQYRIEPGTLTLCFAHKTNAWAQANSALRYIYPAPAPAWTYVNQIAAKQIDWSALGHDSADYLANIMGINDD